MPGDGREDLTLSYGVGFHWACGMHAALENLQEITPLVTC